MGKRLSALGVCDVTLVILRGRKSIARIRPFVGKLPAASFLLYVGRKSSSAPNERRTPERATSAMQSPPAKPNQHPSHSKPRVRLTPRVRVADETRSVRLRTRKPGRQPGLPGRSRTVPRAVSSIGRNALNIIAERTRCEGAEIAVASVSPWPGPLQAMPGRTQHIIEEIPPRRVVRARLALDPIRVLCIVLQRRSSTMCNRQERSPALNGVNRLPAPAAAYRLRRPPRR
jgi:hypothetical protein